MLLSLGVAKTGRNLIIRTHVAHRGHRAGSAPFSAGAFSDHTRPRARKDSDHAQEVGRRAHKVRGASRGSKGKQNRLSKIRCLTGFSKLLNNLLHILSPVGSHDKERVRRVDDNDIVEADGHDETL